LPPGWTSAVDVTSGQTYYVHGQTNHVQWEQPSAHTSPPPAAPPPPPAAASSSQTGAAAFTDVGWLVRYTDLTWEGEIGSGSFGSVYKVTKGGVPLAAKKMSITVDSERARLEGLMRREFRALQQAQHPHIVRLLGIVVDDPKSLVLLMELSPLGSLRTLLDKDVDKVLKSEKAQLSILMGITAAMAFLHSQKPTPILHHDLKSDNVLVWPDAAVGFIAKVSDLGLATGTHGSTMRTTKSKTGAATLAYKAPECFDDAEFTTASEVYAFGIIAWEVLTAEV
jgi:serine/threonine protein kinase